MRKILLTIVSVLNLTIVYAQENFENIAVDAGVSPPGLGASIIDFNVDGLMDIFITAKGSNMLFQRNPGDLKFTEVAHIAGVYYGINSRGATWADYNKDGLPDLFVGNVSGGLSTLYKNEGDRGDGIFTFSDVTDSAGIRDLPMVFSSAWGDYNNDGYIDLFLSTGNAFKKLYKNLGDGSFIEVSYQAGIRDSSIGRGSTWGDYDNDGDLDLYIVNETESGSDFSPENRLYRNNGDGTFTDISEPAGVNCDRIGKGAAWGDYDNDGDLDLFVTNDGKNRFYKNIGNDNFIDIAPDLGFSDSLTSYGVAWGDFNNDGYLDLYVVNNYRLNNLYINSGHGTFNDLGSKLGVADIGSGNSVVIADFNEDGKLDIYLVRSSEPSQLYINKFAENNWLLITVTGKKSPYNGIGAKIILYSGDLTQYREISGGSGYLSQNSMLVHFGLGAHNIIDSLIIRWPAGTIDKILNIKTNQKIHIIEGEGIVSNIKNSNIFQKTFSLFQNYPNPFNQETEIRFYVSRPCKVKLKIYNTLGQLVKTMVNEEKLPGNYSIIWNGKNEKGKDLPSGVYIYILRAKNYIETKKMVLLR